MGIVQERGACHLCGSGLLVHYERDFLLINDGFFLVIVLVNCPNTRVCFFTPLRT